MSYTLLVQGSNPLGYWKLNGSGSAVVGNAATITSGAYTVPPLVTNSASALILKKNGASVSIANSYDAFFKNYDDVLFQIEFWFSFNGNFNGNGYLTNLNSSSAYYTNNQLNILTIYNSTASQQLGSIYYDYTRNTFRFKINGTGNTDAYVPVYNLDTIFYVNALYNNKTLSISVNGEPGVTGYANDVSLFPPKTSSINFLVNPSSISASTQNFVISDLAFYGYPLNKDQVRRRVVIASNTDKPINSTELIETSYFDLSEKGYHILYNSLISGNMFYKNSSYNNNLYYDQGNGLKMKAVQPFTVSNFYPSGSAVITNSTASVSASTSLEMADYGKIFYSEKYQTLTAQISNVANGNVFCLSDAIDNQSLIVNINANTLNIQSYDSVANSVTSLSSSPLTIAAGQTYNIGISTNGQNLYFAASGTNGSTVTGSVVIPALDITNGTILNLINNPYSPSANATTIQNVGLNNTKQTTFANYNFTENKMYMARMSSDFSIGQAQNVIFNVPISHYNTDIVGSRVSWRSMDNISVATSLDGTTWTQIYNGENLNIPYKTIYQDLQLKITAPFEYTYEETNQCLNFFEISLYHNLSFISNDGLYTLVAGTDSSSAHAYSIDSMVHPALQRRNKFGLSFDKTSGTVDGYIIVTPTAPAITPYAVDFWYSPDSFPSASNFLVTGSVTAGLASLYLGNTGLATINSCSVYVNGASIANNFQFNAGEYYHILVNFNASVSGSSIYLNGNQTASGSHSHGSYGYINIWSSSVSVASASTRYAHFVANNISAITDTPSALWSASYTQASPSNLLIDSASGYKFG